MKRTSLQSRIPWTGPQAYGLAVFCLLLGVTFGYLFRGSGSCALPGASTAAASSQATPTSDEQKAALASTVAPLLEAVTKNPVDFDSIVKLGNAYYDGQQYPDAIKYYDLALKIHPDNADVRTDLGTAYS